VAEEVVVLFEQADNPILVARIPNKIIDFFNTINILSCENK
jgi:hypothetical protein